ncbi:hypothetical protein [Streptomyces natalensis]|uniref:hypothetical protein n=1 Tax=Streptomyces natalensis TaxID=68242 RepID=UPI0012FF47D4|nr:hypothetical protein [Streptomyces natalensis]
METPYGQADFPQGIYDETPGEGRPSTTLSMSVRHSFCLTAAKRTSSGGAAFVPSGMSRTSLTTVRAVSI